MRAVPSWIVLVGLMVGSAAVRADEVDDYINAQLPRRHIPGLALAVCREGKVIKAQGYGLANLETNTPVTPDTVFKTGSVSKQFLSTGIMLLAREGKLGLDDKINGYLEGAPDAWKDITIRHLLTHTSGMVEDPPGFEPYKKLSDAEVIKSAYATKLLFAPGEKWSYSNLDYFVLAEIIHKVSGRAWGDFINDREFVPAGMTATRTTTTADIVLHRADGYGVSQGKQINAEDWIAVRPSGAFLSTVLDLAKWDAVLYSDTVVSSAIREQMWTPVKLNNGTTHPYGFGWFLDDWQGHKRVGHQGGLPGFMMAFERFVDDKLTVIVMFNSTTADPKMIAFTVAGFYEPALKPPVLKLIEDTEPEVTAQVKAALDGIVAGHPDMSQFTPGLQAFMNPSRVAGMSAQLRRHGPIQAVTLVQRKVSAESRVYVYRVTYGDEKLLLTWVLNEDKVGGIALDLE